MRYLDTAVCNIPMSGARGRRLDAEISQNVASQRKTSDAQSRQARDEFRLVKAEAKRLHDELAEAIVAAKGAKFGANELRKTLREMSSSDPRRFVLLATKFSAEQNA